MVYSEILTQIYISFVNHFLENDLTASQDMYDCLAKESYNVLTLTTTDIEQL